MVGEIACLQQSLPGSPPTAYKCTEYSGPFNTARIGRIRK
jgi:hypothetical protein